MLVSVLGPVEVRLDGSRVEFARKPTAVLAVLVLHANSWVGVDTIVDALWQDDAPVSAGRNVKTYVWQLRRLLPFLRAQSEDCLYLNVYSPRLQLNQVRPRAHAVRNVVALHGEKLE